MWKFALSPVEFLCVNSAAIRRQLFIRHDGMQHLVIKHVTEKPKRHERLVQRRIDPNDPVFLLDCAKDEIFEWPVLSSPSPDNLVTPKAPTKVPFIQVIKNSAEIEMGPLVTQIQLALHRQVRMSKLSFRLLLLGHGNPFERHSGGRVI